MERRVTFESFENPYSTKLFAEIKGHIGENFKRLEGTISKPYVFLLSRERVHVAALLTLKANCFATLTVNRNPEGVETCNSHMFALSDARDYSISKVPYLEREEEITDQSNFVNNVT